VATTRTQAQQEPLAATPAVRFRPSALHWLGAAASAVALIPLAYLVLRAAGLGLDRIVEVILQERTLALALRSLGLAAAVAIACVVIGIPLAWLVTRTDVPGGRWWLVAAALPLAIPSYVTAYTWVAAIPSFQGFFAAWLVLTLACLPYVVLPVAAVLTRVDPALEDIARSLGHGPVMAFHRAVSPLLMPAAAAGGLLAALYTLSDFGAVSILRFDSFTRVIYTSFQASFDRSTAAVLALVLVVLALGFVLLERRVRGRDQGWRVGGGVARTASRVELGGLRLPALGGLLAVFALAIGFPVVMLAVLMARGSRTFDPAEWFAATINTIEASGIGAIIAIALALPIGMLAARHRDRWARSVEGAAFLSHALPGVLVGLSLVYFGLAVVPSLYQSLALLGFAYAVLFLSNAIGSVRSAAAQVPPVLEDVGRTLGAGGFTVWRRITLPLTAPGIAAGTLLVLVTAMKELPATLMLRPTGMDTLATELWTRTSVSAYAEAAPYAVTLMLVAAVPAFVLARMVGSREGQGS
jgi:iron(III) transport system permease protein